METFNRERFVEMVRKNSIRVNLLDSLLASMGNEPICDKEEASQIIGPNARNACLRAYKTSRNFTGFCYEMFRENDTTQ
jgi:hypothetical protein